MGTGIFSGLKKAGKANQGGLYFAPGDRYIVEIQRVWIKDSRANERFFMVEARILDCQNKLMNLGQVPTWMVKVPNKDDMGLKNVNSFLEALLEIDIETATEEEAAQAGDYVVGEEQPLAGTVCVVETHQIKTDGGKGSDFTVHKWQLPTDLDYKKVGREKPKT